MRFFFLFFACLALLTPQGAATAQDIDAVSLDSLLNLNVSTAARYEQNTADAPASVTLITAEEIRRYGYQSLDQVLSGIRGFYLTQDYVRSFIGTRGFSRTIDYNNRILLLINGHTVNDRVYGTAPMGADLGLDLDMVERIEVVRGPGSALYGTGAMFAVLNIVTRTGNGAEGLAVHGERGSNGHLRSALSLSHSPSDDLHLFVSGSAMDYKGQHLYFSRFDAPSTNNGLAEYRDWARYYGGFASMRYRGFTAQMMMTEADTGIPTAELGSVFNHNGAHFFQHRLFGEVAYEHAQGLDKLFSLRAYYDHIDQSINYPFELDLLELGLEDVAADYSLRGSLQSVGTDGLFRWDVRADHRLVTGFQVVHNPALRLTSGLLLEESGAHISLFDEPLPYTLLSFYAQDEYQARHNLSLTFGLRHDKYLGASSATTPRAALVYHPAETATLKLLYGEAFRAPNQLEIHYGGNVEGIIPNPDLKPEHIRTFEAVWEQHLSSRWTATATAFTYRMHNLISSYRPHPDSLGQFRNLDRVRVNGTEFEIRGQVNRRTDVNASYSLQQAEQESLTTLPVANSPAHVFKLRMATDLGLVSLASEWFAESGRYTHQGTQTPSFLVGNLYVSTRPLRDHWQLSVMLRNVLDADYVLPASRLHDPTPHFIQAARTVTFRLSFVR